MNNSSYSKPRWLRDLTRFLSLKSQFVLTGNIRDLQASEVEAGVVAAVPLLHCLERELKGCGYEDVISFRPFSGFSLPNGGTGDELQAAMARSGLGSENPPGAGVEVLAAALDGFVKSREKPSALVIDFASRLVNRSDVLAPAEHMLFSRAQVASHTASTRPAGDERKPFFNTVIWMADRESDLPDFLTVDNPRIRHIVVSPPDSMTRKTLAGTLLHSLPGARETPSSELETAVDTFVGLTDGLLLMDMSAIAQLSRIEGLRVSEIGDAVRRYKVGVTEDPWRRLDRKKIASGDEFIASRLKGQNHAVVHMLDIIKRAVTGIGRTGSGNRPRGVAFLAGPTGVGKTELAKTVTSLLFGDESAYIRFDMSEFSAEHADQRLIGAPPGYVGYDVGGELTNAIREKPFSVVLFDEIEKAHPRILDKFLQVLDDGVLTSGRGDRVYFSESVILFTSNLGIYKTDATGQRVASVSLDEPYETVAAKVREEIERHFKLVLNRPEILNRIGRNIIVFDFIRRPVAEQIFDQIVSGLLEHTKSLGCAVTVSEDAYSALRELCLQDLTNGGRGIRNMVEAHLANPLSRALFDADVVGGSFEITEIEHGAVTSVKLSESGSQA
ncbi:energy-coupling factor transporter ATP-binding protein EcfA2 [Mesorhizobium shonense]|uniref:Energy-coupling factor transporter ATP-binding protein EcfA2 n=1 Tax=Mesorhizobium shonense TaxID=1209948 RepID=A0ABV2HMN8_9HYPH